MLSHLPANWEQTTSNWRKMVIDNFIISLKQAIGFNIMEGFMRFVFQGELSLWILMLSTASLSISYIMYTFMSSNSFFSSFNSFLFLLMQNWSSFICPIWSHDRMIHYYGLSINEIDVFHPIDLVENPLRCIRQQIFWIERDVWKVLAVLVLSIDITIYIPKIYQKYTNFDVIQQDFTATDTGAVDIWSSD